MILDLNEKQDRNKFKQFTSNALTNSTIVEVKEKKKTRTLMQNRALHRFFTLISNTLNEQGQEFHYTGIKGFELTTRYTPLIVKEFFWKPIQRTMYNIESTRELTTKMINDISDVIIKYFGEKGITLLFPRKEKN